MLLFQNRNKKIQMSNFDLIFASFLIAILKPNFNGIILYFNLLFPSTIFNFEIQKSNFDANLMVFCC